MQFSFKRIASLALALLGALLSHSSFVAPALRAQQADLLVAAISAATLKDGALAPGSLVSLFGSKLATTTASAVDLDPNQAGVQLPYSLGGSTVRVNGQLAQILFVSPQQINFLLPAATGVLTFRSNWEIQVQASDGTVSSGVAEYAEIRPGVFTANGTGKGLPVGTVLRVRSDGTRVNESLFTVENGVITPRPLDFGAATDRLMLTLFATGLRYASDPNRDGNLNESVRLLANGYETTPAFVGVAPGFPGVEQINWEVPRSLIGQTHIRLELEINGAVTPPLAFAQELEIPLLLPPLGTVQWRAAGLEGKRIAALLQTDNIGLAATAEGIFYTSANALDWKLVNYALPSARRTNALFAPGRVNPFLAILMAGTEGSGVLSSFGNDGQTWLDSPIATFPVVAGKRIRAFAANETYVFAGGDELSVARLRCCSVPWERAGAAFAPRINALAANGARVLAGTAANGLYVSANNGDTWAQNSGGVPVNAEVRALAQTGTTFFAGTSAGLYRSTDNGASWLRLTESLPANVVVNALFANGAIVLAGTAEHGVLSSNDGGARWQNLNTGLTNQNVISLSLGARRLLAGTTTGIFAAAINTDANQPPVAQAQQLTLAEDTTKTLTLSGSDPDGDPLNYNVVRGPVHGYLQGAGANLVYVPHENYFGDDQFEFRAHDGKLGSVAATVRLTITPVNDPPQLDLTGDRLMLTGQFSNVQIQTSDPDGIDSAPSAMVKLSVIGLPEGARLSSPQIVYPLNQTGGAMLEIRRLLWVPTAPGTYTITFTATDESTPPLSTTQTITLRVADNPEKGVWARVNSPIRPPRTDFIINLFADGTDLYAVTSEAVALGNPTGQVSLWRSTDGGATWKEANNGLVGIPTVLARAGNALFLGTGQGMLRSSIPTADSSPSWVPINSGLPEIRAITNIAVRGDKIVISTPFGLFLSNNQGASWASINGNLPLTTPPGEQSFFTIATVSSVVFSGETLFASVIRYPGAILASAIPDPAEVEAAFAAQETAGLEAQIAQQSEPTGGVFRSTDNGVTWVPVNNGLGLPVTGLTQFFSITNLTVSGTTLYANGVLGLFRSTNQGDRWQRVPTPTPTLYGIPTVSLGTLRQAIESGDQPNAATQPLPNQIGLPVPLITLLPPVATNGRLYLAPFGHGIYVSREDGSDWLPINQGLDEPTLARFLAAGNRLYCVTSNLVFNGPTDSQALSMRIFTRNLVTQ